MIKLVIFDLDGTLLNTIADLGQACNYALGQHNYPLHEAEEYNFLVGNGVRRLVERAIPEGHKNDADVSEVLQDFMPYYLDHMCDLTRPYDGIPAVLEKLQANGIQIAVASNKFQKATCELVSFYFKNIRFASVLGQREGVPTKPHPQICIDSMAAAGVTPAETLYVGDSSVDMQTALNAGLTSIGVTWGFRPEQELVDNHACHIAHNAQELEEIIWKLK